MKKKYMQPAAELVQFEPQGMMALSSIDVKNGSTDITVDGSDAMSGHRGWNSESWSGGDEE